MCPRQGTVPYKYRYSILLGGRSTGIAASSAEKAKGNQPVLLAGSLAAVAAIL